MRNTLKLLLIFSLGINLTVAQSSQKLNNEIESTQSAIQKLQQELDRQQDYLEDLYSADYGKRAKQDQSKQLEDMQRQIQHLTLMVAELSRSVESMDAVPDTVVVEQESSKEPHRPKFYTRQDSLALLELRKRQAESRQQIETLTLELIQISQQLKDPDRRIALAKKLKEQPLPPKQKPEAKAAGIAIEVINARNIDLAAVELVRQGQTLDQARMNIIDGLGNDQVLDFYQSLDREERYRLYDTADEILIRDGGDLQSARRGALFFYFYVP